MKAIKFETVSEYIDSLPNDSKKIIKSLRSFARKQLPNAKEVISYNMPAFKMESIVLWYAAFKDHISIFPRTSTFKSLKAYASGKGTVRFPKDEPLPFDVIGEFIDVRLKEVHKAAEEKKAKAKARK